MKLSVCMATYNGEKYVEQQLRSILLQLGADDEVVVSDDGSTDRTCDIIESMQDPRIHLYHANCHNATLNFEEALQHITGDIVFLADQDDVWLDGKVERCVKELESCDLVTTDSIVTDDNLRPIHPSFFALYHSGKGLLRNIIYSTYYGSCMAFRRSVLERALPFPQTAEIGHDLWLGLVAEMTSQVQFIDTPYVLYRRHAGTVTSTKRIWHRSSRSLWQKLRTRCLILKHIIHYKTRQGKEYARQSR